MLFEKVIDEDQIEIIEDMACGIWNEYFTPIIGKAQVDYMLDKFQSKKAITKQMEKGFEYYLIKDDEECIGYLGVLPEEEKLFLSKIYIISTERGKGYGRQAIEFLEKVAIEKGSRSISLTVNKNNLGAIEMYKKLGFENKGGVVQDIGNGFIMDDYKMKKVLIYN